MHCSIFNPNANEGEHDAPVTSTRCLKWLLVRFSWRAGSVYMWYTPIPYSIGKMHPVLFDLNVLLLKILLSCANELMREDAGDTEGFKVLQCKSYIGYKITYF